MWDAGGIGSGFTNHATPPATYLFAWKSFQTWREVCSASEPLQRWSLAISLLQHPALLPLGWLSRTWQSSSTGEQLAK